MTEQLAALTRAVTACFPDIRIESARVVESGQNNSVLMVNEGMVFRFPRYVSPRDSSLVDEQLASEATRHR